MGSPAKARGRRPLDAAAIEVDSGATVAGLLDDSLGSRIVRRTISVTLIVTAASLILGTLPLTLPLALLVDLVRGQRLAWSRALLFLALFVAAECVGVALALGLAVVAPLLGRRRSEGAYAALQRNWVRALAVGLTGIFGVRLEVEGAESAAHGPLLLLVRHAHTLDTLLPITVVAIPHRLRPRYVLKRELQWDPCLDIVGHRMPNAFIRRGGGAGEAPRIARLAEGLGERGVVMIYPEGTRFSARGRARRLADLEARGDPLLAAAEGLHHTLPPHVAGVQALVQADPTIDAAIFAHVGLEGVRRLSDLFNGSMIGRRLRIKIWRVPAAAIPREPEALRGWLFEQWAAVDAWVGAALAEPPA